MKVELNDESLPKGAELHVVGLGTLKNGEAVEFDDEAVAVFEQQTGQKITEAFAENVNVHIGSEKKAAEKKKEGGES